MVYMYMYVYVYCICMIMIANTVSYTLCVHACWCILVRQFSLSTKCLALCSFLQKPSLRKSSSATSSNLTSHFAPSSARSKSSAVSRPDHHSHPEPPSSVPVYPSIPSLKKSSSWPQRPAVSTRAGGGSSLPVTQR